MPDARGVGIVVTAVLAAAVVAATLVAGCTSAEDGQANAAGAAGSGAPVSGYQPPTNNAAAISLAPRPRDLSLVGVDPCGLITSQQQSQLGVVAGKRVGNDAKFNGARCVYHLVGLPGDAYDIDAVTAAGIQVWLNQYLIDEFKQVTVNGFPALDGWVRSSGPKSCFTVVDVAAGQMLIVGSWVDMLPVDQLCAKTEAVAGAAVATLRTLK